MEEKKKSNKIMFAVLGIVIAVLIGIVAFLVLRLNNNTGDLSDNAKKLTESNGQKVPIATMEIKDYGTVKIELYPDIAPKTVENFINLSNNGFYDNLTFHRIVKDFMIQGGDKNGDGTGKVTLDDIYNNGINSEYTIEGEFEVNGYKNSLKHTEGIISMARTDYSNFPNADETLIKEGYNSASSQFFIVTKDSPSLNGYYASFGKVIEGMDIIHKIENIQTEETDYGEKSKPVTPPIIEKIRVETNISNKENDNSNNKIAEEQPNFDEYVPITGNSDTDKDLYNDIAIEYVKSAFKNKSSSRISLLHLSALENKRIISIDAYDNQNNPTFAGYYLKIAGNKIKELYDSGKINISGEWSEEDKKYLNSAVKCEDEIISATGQEFSAIFKEKNPDYISWSTLQIDYDWTPEDDSKEKINAKARTIAARNDLNFICTSVYKTLKNGNDVILISMSDPQYSPAQYFLLVEFDSSLEVIKYSDFLRNDDNITLRSAYLPIWGYAEGETTF